ncbi:MAG: tetratricopeptide repeat protein [Flavobacteriaceae bacterium]|nr:tetratricopeptide repeat protein [Flavobacteriaceae bacterium]
MATYNKRGYKPKNKKEREEKVVEESTTAEVFDSLDEKANKTEEFISKYQKSILGGVVVIAVVALGYLGYQNLVLAPKEIEASEEIVQAQRFFDNAMEADTKKMKDSLFGLALNGGRSKLGFLDIADSYGSTKAGKLAHYYAGMAFLELKDFKNAISHLDQFKSDDKILSAMALGAIGDAFLELDQKAEAVSYFEKAAKQNPNNFVSPKFHLKAAQTAIALNEIDKAEKHLKQIKNKFPNSEEAKKVDIFLGKAQALK